MHRDIARCRDNRMCACVSVYLFQNELFFWRRRVCNGKMSQETLQFHKVGQLIDQHLCQETPELRHMNDKATNNTTAGITTCSTMSKAECLLK